MTNIFLITGKGTWQWWWSLHGASRQTYPSLDSSFLGGVGGGGGVGGCLVQTSYNQWGSESQNWKSHWVVWRPDFSEKSQTKWYRHVTRSSGLAKTILQGTVQGGRWRGRQRKRWEDNIKEWTGLEWNITLWKTENCEEWRKLVLKSTVVS